MRSMLPWGILAVLLGLHPAEQSQPPRPAIPWHSQHKAASKEAETSKRLLCLYFTFVECVHAARFERATLADPKVVEILTKSFVCLKVDIALEPQIAAKFEVEACPTLLFLTPAGKKIGRVEGFIEPARFGKIIDAIRGLRP